VPPFSSEAPAEIKLIITVLFYKPQAEQNKGFSAFFVDRLDFTAVSLVRMSTHSLLYKKRFLSPEEFSAMNRFLFLSLIIFFPADRCGKCSYSFVLYFQ